MFLPAGKTVRMKLASAVVTGLQEEEAAAMEEAVVGAMAEA